MPAHSSKRRIASLGVCCCIAICFAFAALGGASAAAQACVGVMVAVGAGIAWGLPDHRLAPAGGVARWVIAALFPMAALALGLLPVPRALASLLAPGMLDARPVAAWWTLATDPRQVPGEIATVGLVFGFAALVAAWAAARSSHELAEAAVTALTCLVATSAGLHAVAGATAMLGVIHPEFVPTPFFAPFVNPHHAGAVMLLGGPIALSMALNREQSPWARGWGAIVAAIALILMVAVNSAGLLIAAGLAAATWAVRREAVRPVVVGVGVVGVVVARKWAMSPSWMHGSVEIREGLWSDALRLLSKYWFAGIGGGNFREAIRAFRSDYAFAAIAHAHNEPLEWLVETGVVGMLGALCAVLVLAPFPLRESARRAGMTFGLLGLGLYVFVDFPLQLPAIAMAAVAVIAILLTKFGPPRPAAPRTVRRALLAVGLFQLPVVGWQVREALVQRATTAVAAYDKDPAGAAQGARMLSWLHGAGEMRSLYAAWEAEARGDTDAAVALALGVRANYPDDPDALRNAARVLARARHYDEAADLLLRSAERDPADYRPWVMLAQVARASGDRSLAAKRWAEAFRRGAPGLDVAYAGLPVGLYWVEALRDVGANYSVELAYLLFRKGELEVALLAIQQAADLDPQTNGDDLLKPALLVRLGRPAEAESWLARVLLRRPDDAKVLGAYGEALAALGRHDEATVAFVHGSRTAPALRVRALESAEADGGTDAALALAQRFEVDGGMEPALALHIAGLHQRAGHAGPCIQEIQRWGLLNGPASPGAMKLMDTCRRMTR